MMRCDTNTEWRKVIAVINFDLLLTSDLGCSESVE